MTARSITILATTVIIVTSSGPALAHDPNEGSRRHWYGADPAWSRPWHDSARVRVFLVFEERPTAERATTILVTTPQGFTSDDSWMFGRLISCPGRTVGADERCKAEGSQIGNDLLPGRFSVTLDGAEKGFPFTYRWGPAGEYYGFVRVVDRGQVLHLHLHIDVAEDPAGNARQGPLVIPVEANLVGRTVSPDTDSPRPPGWLKPIAYLVLVVLILAGGYSLIRIPLKMRCRNDEVD